MSEIYEPHVIKSVHGYQKGKSPITNARAHINKAAIIKIDLANFFPGISGGMIHSALTSHPYHMQPRAATLITALCTYRGILPQGSPASPIISNIVARSLDIKLINFAKKHRCTFTRYADDITISFTNHHHASRSIFYEEENLRLSDELKDIFTSKNFVINEDKLRFRKYYNRQMVNGIIINNKKLNLSRQYVNEIKLLIHIYARYGKAAAERSFSKKHKRNRYSADGKFDILKTIRGKLEYLKYIKGYDDSVFLALARKFKVIDSEY